MNATIVQCKGKYGEGLVATCRASSTVTAEVGVEVKMVGTGVFMDEEDLTEKYKGKPKRLAAILKNTDTYYDDRGEVLLYEDMTYQSSKVESSSIKRTNETVVDDINPQKVCKTIGIEWAQYRS